MLSYTTLKTLAQKSVGHELKSISAVYDAFQNNSSLEKLRIPLTAIVDYCGFRVLVQSLVPISSNTLKFGSRDGGLTIHTEDKIACLIMETLGKELFLKKHIVKDAMGKKKEIVGPCDLELHKSLEGDHYYCIDLARMFPPDIDPNSPSSIFYRLLRPEFLKWYKKALSSDTFSKFSSGDPNKLTHEKEVMEAVRVLRTKRIPQIAKLMRSDKSGAWMTRTMQQFGVNCRYLGLLRQSLTEKDLRATALGEMCARILSEQLKFHLRETAKKNGLSRKYIFFELTAKFFNSILDNKVFGAEGSTVLLWSGQKGIKRKLVEKFEQALFEEERSESFDLRQSVNLVKLIERIEEKVGILMKQSTREKIESVGQEKMESFSFSVFDFSEISARAKSLDFISFSIAEGMKKQAEEKPFKEKIQLLQQSADVIEQTGMGSSEHKLWWMKVCLEITKLQITNNFQQRNGQKAMTKKDVEEKLEVLVKEVSHFVLSCEAMEEKVPNKLSLIESEIVNQKSMLIQVGEDWCKKLELSLHCFSLLNKLIGEWN